MECDNGCWNGVFSTGDTYDLCERCGGTGYLSDEEVIKRKEREIKELEKKLLNKDKK